MDSLLEVRGLSVRFPSRDGFLGFGRSWKRAVEDVSFVVNRGETLGIVGESGSGKTTVGRAILGLNRPQAGAIRFAGRTLHGRGGWSRREAARRIQAVFQDPLACLNPRQRVGAAIVEGAVFHGLVGAEDAAAKARELLAAVGLEPELSARLPHELSGGQRQRVCIARAIALKPELLICDEAVSALDLSVRRSVLELLAELKAKLGLSMIFITHDLGVVRHVADRVAVMNAGRIVESGPAEEILRHPRESYTRSLMAAVPRIGKPL